jgi:hypothetical protein
VAVYRYVTEGSFDAYMWQALETKAKFIAQVMTGEAAVRRAEDIGGQELSYAEVKVIASGNPAVLTLAEADAELQRLTVLKKNHADEQYLARKRLRELPETIESLNRRLATLTADLETAATHASDPVTIGRRACAGKDLLDALGRSLDALPKQVWDARRIPLGVIRGLAFGIARHPRFAPEVYLEGATTRQVPLSREHHGPRAVLNAVERLAAGYSSSCDSVRQDLAITEGQLRDYRARLGLPFTYDADLAELTALRDQLQDRLSGKPADSGTEQRPSICDLAERIKSLKAAHTIEAAPERPPAPHGRGIGHRTVAPSRSDSRRRSGDRGERRGSCGERASHRPHPRRRRPPAGAAAQTALPALRDSRSARASLAAPSTAGTSLEGVPLALSYLALNPDGTKAPLKGHRSRPAITRRSPHSPAARTTCRAVGWTPSRSRKPCRSSCSPPPGAPTTASRSRPPPPSPARPPFPRPAWRMWA